MSLGKKTDDFSQEKNKNIPDKIHGELWSNHALKTSPTKQMACEDYGKTSNLFRFVSVSLHFQNSPLF